LRYFSDLFTLQIIGARPAWKDLGWGGLACGDSRQQNKLKLEKSDLVGVAEKS
jgi:hypothetical protein